MKIVTESISLTEIKELAVIGFGNLIKAVIDVEQELMALDAELHSDLEALLLEKGSKQKNLWGINLYPDMAETDFIEFDSMINMRPSQGNRSRSVDSQEVQKKIIEIVNKRVKR